MKYVNLALALHHHQPVGNLPEVLEECYRKCYLPILDAIGRYPRLRFNLSYSGPLLRFFAQHHPEFLEKLKWLIAGRQVEMMATGFYEPILAEIEEDDRQGQIQLTKDWMDEHLGITVKGGWLAEGVWDNSLARTFRRAGLSYTIVRNERMLQAGVPESKLHGYYVTEYFGSVLRLFPRDPNLYRQIPYGEPEELMIYLRRMANRGLGLTLTFDDDAERWGVWPGSYEKIQQSGRMEELFARLNDAGNWLQMRTFSEIISDEPPHDRCYIPPGTSIELGMWSLPDESRQLFAAALSNIQQRHDANRFLPFFRAGSWGGFRGRYFESNLMEKKGLWLKSRLPQLATEEEQAKVQDLLWQTQCNTAYWHGTSGGIYLPHLRQAIWERLLVAQQRIFAPVLDWQVEKLDFTANDLEEILAFNAAVSFMVSPAYGGSCLELSLIGAKWNWANTLTRRPETDPLTTKAGQELRIGGASIDRYERHIFQERLINRHVTTEQLMQGKFCEDGDFIDNPYKFIGARKRKDGIEIELERLGKYSGTGRIQPIRIIKTYIWDRTGAYLTLHYEIKNESVLPLNTCLAIELNLGTVPLQGKHDGVIISGGKKHGLDQGWYEDLAERMELCLANGVYFEVRGEEPLMIWSYPINTQSEADDRASLIRQGNCFLFGWLLNLPPGEHTTRELMVETGSRMPTA